MHKPLRSKKQRTKAAIRCLPFDLVEAGNCCRPTGQLRKPAWSCRVVPDRVLRQRLDIPMARCMSRAKSVKGCIFLMDA